jgi:CspA family cold shock protein
MSENDDDFCVAVVKWFNSEKAYGFLALPGEGVDIFVHVNQLRKSGITRHLKEGERVKFRTSKGPKGAFATNITILDA